MASESSELPDKALPPVIADVARAAAVPAVSGADSKPKVEAKPQPKVEVKPEPKAEAKPEPKADAKPEPKAEAKPEPKAEAKPGPKVEAKPEPKVEASAAPRVETMPVVALHSTPLPATKPAVASTAVAVRDAAAKPMETLMSTTEEFVTFGQANIEAVLKSGQIWASGVQDLGRTVAENAQAQIDHSLATWKALAGVKSIKEAVDVQTARAREALERAVADTGRLTDASLKLAEQAMAPITARLNVATERFGRQA